MKVDSNTEELIRDFLLQILQHPIQFTASRLCSINYPFMAGVRLVQITLERFLNFNFFQLITSIVSYLIILVQFYGIKP